MDQFFEPIGIAALNRAELATTGPVLIYAEVEDGVVSADLFYLRRGGQLVYKQCGPDLQDLAYQFWEASKQMPGWREWRAVAYFIKPGGAEFTIEFTYVHQLIDDESIIERRRRAVSKYFGSQRATFVG